MGSPQFVGSDPLLTDFFLVPESSFLEKYLSHWVQVEFWHRVRVCGIWE